MFKKQSRQPFQKFSGAIKPKHTNYTKKRKINRDYLATIVPHYYPQVFPNLKDKTGWQNVICPFHDDKTPSLSISLDHGGFKCFACGISGDLVTFHRLRQQKTFEETITDLDAWEK